MYLATHHRHRRYRTRRLGVGTMLFMVFLVIFMLLLMLVVNYTYLAMVQLRTGDVTDTLARTAATELLDDSLLDAPSSYAPADDVDDAEATVATYLDQLNAAAEVSLHLRYVQGSTDPADTDVFVTAGSVADVTAPITSANFVPYDPLNPTANRLNTLAIEASRPKNGANPLYLFVRNVFTPQTATIGTTSYATLDSRLIGLQPTPTVNTPVIPIGIVAGDWPNRLMDIDGKPRKDFRGTISDTGGSLVLLDFHRPGAVTVDGAFADKILNGLDQTDINIDDGNPATPSYFLGPVVEGQVALENMPAQGTIDVSDALILEPALNQIADPGLATGERRIFPLCTPAMGGAADIVGFVAARVLDAQVIGNQLQLDLEPEFYVHFTAVTAPVYDDGVNPAVNVPENVYIHKLRLSR